MNKVVVSVPGKVHLMGEHAVVYGKPALLAAINVRLSVAIEPSKKLEIISSEPTDYARHAVDFLLDQFRIKDPAPFTVTIDSQIPAGYHLGSSAAVAVGLAGAMMYYFKKLWNPIRINELAYEIEKKQHGNPSGGDNTTVTVGGFVWFRKELEFLKSIWQLPFKPHPSLDHFFLIDTGRPKETTGEMVALVSTKYKEQSTKFDKLFAENEQQTKRVAKALKEGNEKELIDAIRVGERTLEGMGVVSKKVIPLIRKIERAGGAAKILGGGGKADGVGFLLCHHSNPKVVKEKKQYIALGEEGIRLEQK
jgi:mevalonate kinase